MNVASIGSSSLVGSRFCELAEQKLNLIRADLNSEPKIDITKNSSVENFFREHDFECIVLFSAFTDVDRAQEQNGDKNGSCWQINVEGTKNIVSACKKLDKKLVLISTDFIFDGEAGPYSEDSPPGPNNNKVSWYGITKQESEKIAKTLDDAIILRISYPFRAQYEIKTDFARNILKRYKENNLFPLFSDQQITPTFIDDIAPAIVLLLTSNKTGIFHLASPITTTPLEFAKYLVEKFGLDSKKIKKTSIVEFLKKEGATPRPKLAGLKTEKIESFGFTPTSWQEGIDELFRQTQDELI